MKKQKQKNNNNIFHTTIELILIIILLVSMFPIQGVIIDTGVDIEIENETYRVNQAMNFSIIIIADTYVVFNSTGWNITAPSNILITLRHINESTSNAAENDELLEFEVYMVSGTTDISISGFGLNINHTIYKDGSPDSTFLSNSTGCIEITISSGVSYIYTVYKGENSAPVISNPFPQDGATGVSPIGSPVNINVYDADGNTMSTDMWSNSTGTWTQVAGWDVRATPPAGYREPLNDIEPDGDWDTLDWNDWWAPSFGWQGNGTRAYYNNHSVTQNWNMTNYLTTYYWSVNTTDGAIWTNQTFSFTTSANTAPTVSNPSPSNGEMGVSINLASLSIDIADNEDTFNWTITTSPNIGSNNANSASNGTKTCNVAGLSYDGYYTWTVSVTDGTTWTNATYDFTVESGGPPPNSAPTVSDPYPADEATLMPLTPVCHVLVADADLDNIDVNFYWYNDTSQWEKMQTNSSVSPGNTVYWNFSNASEYNTTYDWKVTVYDGTDNITYTYNFTTYPNNPVISTYSPTDDAVNVVRNTTVSVTVFDYQGDTMNITWRSNSSGSWVDFGYNSSVSNGTFSQSFINSTGYSTRYWWSVNISSSWTNATYSFTTESNVAPVISDPLPRDGRLWVSTYTANISVVITDANSDFNYTIQTSPDVGSISENDVGDGVKTCVISGLSFSTTYTWYVNATDGETWTNISYGFTTKGSSDFDIEGFKLNLPEWALGPYKVYVGDFIWMFLFVGVIAVTWGSSKHISSVFIVILLTFAAYGTQRVFIDNSEISLLFSLIAAVCIAAIMLGLFLRKRHG